MEGPMEGHTAGIEPEFNPAMADDEPLTPFDVLDRTERDGLIKLLIGFGVLLAAALIVFKLYQPGVRARTDPPLITAENTPFKVVPEDAGGLQAPDQDKEVFEVMSGKTPSTDVVTLPPPEVPVNLPVRDEPAPATSATVEAPTPAPTKSAPASAPEAQAPKPKPPAPKPAVVTPKPAAPALVQAPVPSAPAATGSSNWVVQIASLRSEAEAQASYNAVANKNASILSGFRSDIRRVDLAEKGIYYRARVAGFADKAAASRTCASLKAAGQACFVTRS